MDDRLAVVEQVVSCTRCDLSSHCRAPVPFRGKPSRIVIVGEAPGALEDQEGRPFIGPSGQRLKEMLTYVGLTEPMGVVNTVSCFPHGTPQPEHVRACEDNKWAQINYLNPTYLLLLGRVALKAMRPDLDLHHGRSRPFIVRDRVCWSTYHPAAALRNGRFDTDMRKDLKLFAAMVELEDWEALVPDNCSGCAAPATWFEEESCLGWCSIHLPNSQADAYHARMQLLKDELARARRA